MLKELPLHPDDLAYPHAAAGQLTDQAAQVLELAGLRSIEWTTMVSPIAGKRQHRR